MSSDLPRSDGRKASSRIARRGFVLGGLAAVLGVGAVGSARWFNVSAQVSAGDLSAPDAHVAAVAGEITLVDIRRPDEWARTGVPEGGVGIDMRRDDFIEALLAQTGGDRDKPVALICARGVRSARLTARLQDAGFTQIIDVPEGMLGSGAGPGWVKRELPVVR
ncbi:rhodanese-like domain-containing protein [Sulfitobacter sp. JB4-11]|uniref:rhodanese-like domain-containing protein n=1 Tax=Sulfitobacter rhodophyticola TaxID=3238304 RepID=UPI003515DE8E